MKQLIALVCISSLFLATTSSAQKKVDITKAEQSFNGVYNAFNSGKLEELDKYIAADYIEHSPDPMQEPGLAGLKKSMTEFREGFPDLKFTSEKVFIAGDMACDMFHLTGTNTGPMMGMQPTGKKIDIMGTDVVRFDAHGKGVEHWAFSEERKMMEQLGLLPPMHLPPSTKK